MIFINGKIYEKKEDAKISVFDHGFLYGDGVFEGIRYYHGRAFRLKEHLERLFASAKAIRLTINETREELAAIIDLLIKKRGADDGYIRLNVTRGTGDLGLNPYACPRASTIVIADAIQLYPAEYYKTGVKVVTSSLRRVAVDALDPRIKSLNYLNNVLAKFDALDRGAQEALLLSADGLVAECTGDNIFYFKQGVLATPEAAAGALAGITRGVVIGLAGAAGIPVAERRTSLYDLYTADEVFLTGTAAEIVPVVSLDGRTVGDGLPGEFTHDLREAFRKEIEASCRPTTAVIAVE